MLKKLLINYSKQQTKLETLKWQLFLFIFIPRPFLPSHSDEHLFVGLKHDIKERVKR